MLEGTGITKRFGGLIALNNVDFRIDEEEILALIGPNGSGKTTLFNVITGLIKPDKGRVTFNGSDITHKPPHEIAKSGIARTFQIVRPFKNLSVRENVAIAAMHGKEPLDMRRALKRAEELLRVVGLEDRIYSTANSLTLMEMKRMEVARALALSPRILLLDEPMAGLRPSEIDQANQLINHIRAELGVSVFLVEHVMKVVVSVADRVMVLNYGEKIAEGTPTQVMNETKVIEAYLGAREMR